MFGDEVLLLKFYLLSNNYPNLSNRYCSCYNTPGPWQVIPTSLQFRSSHWQQPSDQYVMFSPLLKNPDLKILVIKKVHILHGECPLKLAGRKFETW